MEGPVPVDGPPGWGARLLRFRHQFYHKHTIYPQYKQLLARSLAGESLTPAEAAYVRHFDISLDTECGMVLSLCGALLFSGVAVQFRRSQRVVPRSAVIAGGLIAVNLLLFSSLSATLRWLVAPPALGQSAAGDAL